MIRNLLFLVVLSCGLFSCQFEDPDDLDEIRYDAEYAFPLVDSRISLEKLLESVEEVTTILIDEEGRIRFRYQGDVISQTSDDLFADINQSLPPFIPVTSNVMALPLETSDGIVVDRVDLKAGQLIYYFENRNPDPLEVEIILPQLLKNGVPMRFTHSVPAYDGSGDVPRVTNVLFPTSLKDYTILSENDSIYVEYSALRSDGKEETLSAFAIRIQDLSFRYAEGYLGNQIHKGGRDTIEIDFFDNWVQGNVFFEDPQITFFIENSFGVPTRSIVNLFNVITVQGKVLPLESSFVEEGIDFPYPDRSEVGKVATSSFTFTKDNSNVEDLLGAGPVAVDYDVDALTNPDNNTSIRGFVTDSSFYRVRVEVELPLFGKASDFAAMDTIDLDFTTFEDIEEAEFKVVADNGLPLAVDVQGYFIDSKDRVLDSLLDERQRIVAAAPVDEEGIARETIRKVTYSPFTSDRFKTIRRADRLVLSAAFSTTQEGQIPVRPLADQEVRIRIGAVVNVGN